MQQKTRQIAKKLEDVVQKGYLISPDFPIVSWISFFTVLKGICDVRMVYNGTSNGLNGCLWAPWFPLSTIKTVERALVPGTVLGDLDIGEVFLNSPLRSTIQKYTGVDLSLYRNYFVDPTICPDIVC